MHYSEVNFDHLVKKVLWIYPASIMAPCYDTNVNKMIFMLLVKHSSIVDNWCSDYHCHVTPFQELVALSHIFIVLNRFWGSGIWKDIARMTVSAPWCPQTQLQNLKWPGVIRQLRTRIICRLAHLPGQIWPRLDALRAVNQSIYAWPLHMPCASSQYGGLRGWNFLHYSFDALDMSAPCGQVRSCIAFCNLVTIPPHSFAQNSHSPPRLQKGTY